MHLPAVVHPATNSKHPAIRIPAVEIRHLARQRRKTNRSHAVARARAPRQVDDAVTHSRAGATAKLGATQLVGRELRAVVARKQRVQHRHLVPALVRRRRLHIHVRIVVDHGAADLNDAVAHGG